MLLIHNNAKALEEELFNQEQTPIDRANVFYAAKNNLDENNKPKRTVEQIIQRTITGDIVELALIKTLNGTKVHFNAGYDFIANEIRYEVKSTSNWQGNWTFYPNKYQFLIDNIDNVDRIALGTIIDNKVYLLIVTKADTFFDNSVKSNYNQGQYYYNHKQALKSKQCITF